MCYELRRLRRGDLPEVTDIYNAACRDRESTQGTRPWSVAEMNRFLFALRPSFVSYTCISKGKVIGWAALTRHHINEGVRQTAEMSLFVQARFRRQGVGSALARAILSQQSTADLHCILAMSFADAPNVISFAQKKCCLSISGCLPAAFSDSGHNYDILILQRLITA
ncbi:GNAT family N-acetyltransferase [Bradyrhizobium canariense]|uniref:GNAT family N-acetyltransferase n=2 Tax=Bradyrhizobium TaxID=374 RepID=UPI000A195C14|nr:GNAT family N-acetyltransferase [Bradyrhizobium canariense]OSI32972.1 phosphinothricin acetyltransferase [Bradyrhizobium canariense]OSI36946.1 phosphinothricin acetyltransferase [Bradyrhizobium canariense]OSI50371.1 phosphinothricin acetyltransferase [Bradyrhizobium canariense]OSI55774.1 phosphinothricin acetyltransferase [Bradyrhizobium canariense]OSI59069.1 phosphinothricin acetyltransferase [Bradyrhizobium canariense]